MRVKGRVKDVENGLKMWFFIVIFLLFLKKGVLSQLSTGLSIMHIQSLDSSRHIKNMYNIRPFVRGGGKRHQRTTVRRNNRNEL